VSDLQALWDRAREIGATDLYTLQDGRVRAQIFVWSEDLFRGSSSAVATSPAAALEAAIASVDTPDPVPSLHKLGEPRPAYPWGFTDRYKETP
jgi:hypothetical protein